MIAYYALGGGLGHLARAHALLHTLGISEPVTLITASDHAMDQRVIGDYEMLAAPRVLAGDPAAFRAWIQERLAALQPRALFIDAFPAGILGELDDLSLGAATPIYHVARLLRWQVYRRQLPPNPPCFAATYMVEAVTPDHEDFLQAHSDELRHVELRDPPAHVHQEAMDALRDMARGAAPIWLVVHSGPENEIMELVAYAQDMAAIERVGPRLVLIAPTRPAPLDANVAHLDVFPAQTLYSLADRIITACGFNAMRQAAPYADRHRFLPFARHFDDQFLRAARRRHRNGRQRYM